MTLTYIFLGYQAAHGLGINAGVTVVHKKSTFLCPLSRHSLNGLMHEVGKRRGKCTILYKEFS